jgi:hypothetical protein
MTSQKPPARRPRSRGASSPAGGTPPTIEQQMMEAAERLSVPQALGTAVGSVHETDMTDEEMEALYSEGERLSDATLKRKGLKVGFRGLEGTGKTFDSMTAAGLVPENLNLSAETSVLLTEGILPRGDPVFIIDTENKAYKLRHKFKTTGKNIIVFPIFYDDSAHLMQIEPTKCLIKLARILTMIIKKFPDQGTIVIDSATDVTRWVIKHIKYKLIEKGLEPASLGEHMRLQPGDYQIRDDLWEYILDILKNCKHHVIFTAHDKQDWSFDKDADGNIVGKTDLYSARWYSEVPFAVDIVMRLFRTFDAQGRPAAWKGEIVKNQYDDGMRIEIENPTFWRLVDRIVPISHSIEIEALRDKIEERRAEIQAKKDEIARRRSNQDVNNQAAGQ